LSARAGHELVVTTDAIIAGVDFFANDPAGAVAQKALRVNLSDLAAKGAEPFGYLLTLALPANMRAAWLRAFASGLKHDQKRFGITLLGGDISSTPGPLCISVTAFGQVPRGRAVLRSGAKPGDLVFVTGTIGDSAGGLAAFEAFFAHMPPDSETGIAVVIVQHLDPDHKSILTELVRRYTKMQVFEVSDGVKIEPNCAYIIRPNRDLSLLNGKLHLIAFHF